MRSENRCTFSLCQCNVQDRFADVAKVGGLPTPSAYIAHHSDHYSQQQILQTAKRELSTVQRETFVGANFRIN